MRSRVLYLPSRISPEASESIAFYRAILDDLRTEYDVDIFRWPFITGGPDIEPTWEALTSAIRDAITPGCHVVALGICTIPAMLALGSGWSKAASFTALALFLSPGTLRALGMFALADAASINFRSTRARQRIRLLMSGASEQEWTQAVEIIDAGVTDWGRLDSLSQSLEEVNLIKGKVFIQIPTLVLNTPIRVAGSSDMEQVVGQFFGDLSLGATPFQEVRLQDEHQGHSLAREIVPFMQEAGARGVQASTS